MANTEGRGPRIFPRSVVPMLLRLEARAISQLRPGILRSVTQLFKVFARQLVVGIDLQGPLKVKLGFSKVADFRQGAA